MKKIKQVLSICLVVLACTLNGYSQISFSDITVWAGSGTNRAALVIEWSTDSGYISKVWGYRWNGTKTGRDMLNAVKQLDSRIYELAGSYGEATVYGLGYDVDCDGFTYVSGSNETGHAADSADVYNEGWMYQGYWSYWVSTDGSSWSYSDYGISGRTLTNGSWDGWRFAYAPSWTANAPDQPVAATLCSSALAAASASLKASALSTASISEGTDVTMYPNPCTTYAHIKVEGSTNISICDMYGKLLLQQQFETDNPTVDVSNLSHGVYIIKIKTAGKEVIKRLIKN
jgi:hypothetical protein